MDFVSHKLADEDSVCSGRVLVGSLLILVSNPLHFRSSKFEAYGLYLLVVSLFLLLLYVILLIQRKGKMYDCHHLPRSSLSDSSVFWESL